MESSRARDIDTIIIIVYYMVFVNRFLKISFYFGYFFCSFFRICQIWEKGHKKMCFVFPFMGIDKPHSLCYNDILRYYVHARDA